MVIQRSNVGGAYGPAGAVIVLLGAELTHGLAEARGKPILPTAHAVEMEATLKEKKTF